MTNANLHDYARLPGDAYYTIEAGRLIAVLDGVVPVKGKVLEPAAGAGHMVDVLAKLPGVTNVIASDIAPMRADIEPRAIEDLRSDFSIGWLVSNLPFYRQDQLMARLLATYPQATHAYLVRSAFLPPAKRKRLIHTNPRLDRVIQIVRRPRWLEGTTGSPAVDYSWLVFAPEGREPAPPTLHFEQVLS